MISIVGTSADNILIAGLDGLLHFDGETWQAVQETSAHYDNAFLGPNESFWVSGFYQYTPLKSNTRSGSLAGRLSEDLYTEFFDLKMNAGWLMNDETLVVANGRRAPREGTEHPFGIYAVDASGAEPELTPLDETSHPFWALWGDERWLFGVGEGGTVFRYGIQGTPSR